MTVELSPAAIEAVAAAVVERLRVEADPARPSDELVDAAELARRFGVSRDTVYANAKAWGGNKVGTGPKSHWRFDPAVVAERLGAEKPSPAPLPRRRAPSPSPVELLPIRR